MRGVTCGAGCGRSRVATILCSLAGSRLRIDPAAQGVVGIVSPMELPGATGAGAPAIGALAAGCRVLLKPSELTPRSVGAAQAVVAARFAVDELPSIAGDADVGKAFTRLPFDHLFFTGSTAVGRHVARAAADEPDAGHAGTGRQVARRWSTTTRSRAARAAAHVGQAAATRARPCIAPDYALVPAARVDEFVGAIARRLRALYPISAANPDYTPIVNPRHYARLVALVDDARAKAAGVIVTSGRGRSRRGDVLPPTLLVGVNDRWR